MWSEVTQVLLSSLCCSFGICLKIYTYVKVFKKLNGDEWNPCDMLHIRADVSSSRLNHAQLVNAYNRPAVHCRGNIARNVGLFGERWKKQAKLSRRFSCEQIPTCRLRVWEERDKVRDLSGNTNRAAWQAACLVLERKSSTRCWYDESEHWNWVRILCSVK